MAAGQVQTRGESSQAGAAPTHAQTGRVVTEGEAAAHALVVRVLAHLLAHVAHAAEPAAAPAHVSVHRRVQVRGAERVKRFGVERPEQIVHAVLRPLLLGLRRHLSISCLDAIFLHCQWSVNLQR